MNKLKLNIRRPFSGFTLQGKQLRFSQHIGIIIFLLLVGVIVRLYFFSGFVLGDDPTYAQYVSQILRGEYPKIEKYAVFACRPLLLFLTAVPIYLFGWQEWSFVLPILIASLLNIVIVYTAGNKLHSPLAGILGALAYLTFPLDAVNATTYSNDILLSTFIWGGGLLLIYSYDKYQKKKYQLLTLVSGLLVGAAVAIKLNAIVASSLFMAVLLLGLWRKLKKGGYKTLLAWGIGWLAINILLCLFFIYLSGDFIAHYHIEKRFNITHKPSGFIPDVSNLTPFLLVYPKLILSIWKAGHSGYFFLPYGYFFLLFLCCLPLTIIKRFRACRLPAALSLFYLLVMEFAPLQLFPNYVPIHRLPRFLHIASIPAAVAIGIAFSLLLSNRSKIVKVISGLVILLLLITSLYWTWAKAYFYQDCALDRRWVWSIVRNFSGREIVIDPEMLSYLEFRSGYQPLIPIRFAEEIPRAFSEPTIVVLDGSRRPDLYPGYANAWRKGKYPEDQYIIAEAHFPLKLWRPSNVRMYNLPANITNSYHHTSLEGMQRVGELDVGNPDSEKRFNYKIEEQTWEGFRKFSYPDGVLCGDNGRAYRGREEMTLHKLQPNRPLIILKRFDPAVKNQEVEVYFNAELVGIWKFNEKSSFGEWRENTFTIPSERIGLPEATLAFSFQKSAFDINSFYFWFYQPEESSN